MDFSRTSFTPEQLQELQSLLRSQNPYFKPDVSIPGGIHYPPGSPYAVEMAKWETTYTKWGAPGRPNFVPTAFPAMLYRVTRKENGQLDLSDHVVANSEHEQRNLESRGYVMGGPGEAVKALEAREAEIAQLAAERAFTDRRMSELAQREAAAADDATAAHLPVIEETPIRRGPGRPRKDEVR